MTIPLDQIHYGTDPLTKTHLHKPVTHLSTANKLCGVTLEASNLLNWQDSEHIHLVGFHPKYSPHTLAPLWVKSAWYENPFLSECLCFTECYAEVQKVKTDVEMCPWCAPILKLCFWINKLLIVGIRRYFFGGKEIWDVFLLVWFQAWLK